MKESMSHTINILAWVTPVRVDKNEVTDANENVKDEDRLRTWSLKMAEIGKIFSYVKYEILVVEEANDQWVSD